jgi:hypothetical protein
MFRAERPRSAKRNAALRSSIYVRTFRCAIESGSAQGPPQARPALWLNYRAAAAEMAMVAKPCPVNRWRPVHRRWHLMGTLRRRLGRNWPSHYGHRQPGASPELADRE